MLPYQMIEIREYVDTKDRSPYGDWFGRLKAQAAAKVAVALVRMEQGNLSNVKGIGAGVFENRIDFGPGLSRASTETLPPSSCPGLSGASTESLAPTGSHGCPA